MIIDPWGTVITKASDRECVILAELDFEYLNQVRARMPVQKHIKLKN
jgi:deaminated glutathione amidase